MDIHHSQMGHKPQIAVVSRNTLAASGLASLIESVMPMAEVRVFNAMTEIHESEMVKFVHFFISTKTLLENPDIFASLSHKTIVITDGARPATIPACFRTLDATLDSRSLLREFLKLAELAHSGGRKLPAEMASKHAGETKPQELTPREIEVLRELVLGNINKEIADHLNISLTTVITHRKNIMEKLHAKSVATLAIYAVMHGIVPADKI